MAGPNEHYLPRLLQRGFLIDRPGEWTVLATKTAVGPKSLKWIGSEIYFNSGSAEGKSVDDALTVFENSIGNHVAQWRKSDGEVVDAELASKLVLHLSTRVKQTRSRIVDLSDAALRGVSRIILNENRLKRFLINEIKSKDGDTQKAIRQRLMLERVESGEIERLVSFYSEIAIDRVRKDVSEAIDQFSKMIEILDLIKSDVVSDVHRKNVVHPFSGKRYDRLAALNWSVKKFPSKNFVLADCAAIVVPRSGPAGPLLFWEREVQSSIVLPISKDVLMIGGNPDYVDADIFNFNSAYCSDSFFISNSEDVATSLKKYIGLAYHNFQDRMDQFARTWNLPI